MPVRKNGLRGSRGLSLMNHFKALDGSLGLCPHDGHPTARKPCSGQIWIQSDGALHERSPPVVLESEVRENLAAPSQDKGIVVCARQRRTSQLRGPKVRKC